MPAPCKPCSRFAMWAYFRSAFSLILVNFLLKVAPSQDGMDDSNFEDIYRALMTGFSYFNREYKHLDSDAVLGLRVVEGTVYIIKEAKIFFFLLGLCPGAPLH